MEADSVLRQVATVAKPAQFKVKAFVGEDLPLERVVGISRSFTPFLHTTV